jgi:hypothetical protein
MTDAEILALRAKARSCREERLLLERENERLRRELEELRENGFASNNRDRVLWLKEKARLEAAVRKLRKELAIRDLALKHVEAEANARG